jgi:uncharacterized RDD family membrane protein YckC
MASSQVATAASFSTSYAGLGRRIVAHFIDVLIASAVMLAAAFFMRWLHAVGVWTVQSLPADESDPLVLWQGLRAAAKAAVIVAFIVSMGPIYLALFEASTRQAGVGKRLLNVYVIDVHEGRPRLGQPCLEA